MGGPESCREDSRHFHHAGAWLEEECREHLGLIRGLYKRGRLPSFEAGVGWRQDKTRERRVEAARRKAYCGQDCDWGPCSECPISTDGIMVAGLQPVPEALGAKQSMVLVLHSYIRYSQICAQVVRAALKPQIRVEAERAAGANVKVTKAKTSGSNITSQELITLEDATPSIAHE
ncbi:ATP5E synthase, partial [Polypterus senegalus]